MILPVRTQIVGTDHCSHNNMETKVDTLKKKTILKKTIVDRNKSKSMKVSQQSDIVAFAHQSGNEREGSRPVS